MPARGLEREALEQAQRALGPAQRERAPEPCRPQQLLALPERAQPAQLRWLVDLRLSPPVQPLQTWELA